MALFTGMFWVALIVAIAFAVALGIALASHIWVILGVLLVVVVLLAILWLIVGLAGFGLEELATWREKLGITQTATYGLLLIASAAAVGSFWLNIEKPGQDWSPWFRGAVKIFMACGAFGGTLGLAESAILWVRQKRGKIVSAPDVDGV